MGHNVALEGPFSRLKLSFFSRTDKYLFGCLGIFSYAILFVFFIHRYFYTRLSHRFSYSWRQAHA